MTRNEKIAEAYQDYLGLGGVLQSNPWFAFKAGVEWADEHPKNIWHDASEIPKNRKWILMQFGEDCYDTYMLRHFDADIFCDWCKEYEVLRWAYIDDLLPKGGEKC